MATSSDSSWRKFRKLRPTRESLRKRARNLESKTLRHAQTFIIARFDNIKSVRRHAFGWLAFVGLLIGVSAFQLIGYQRSYSLYAPTSGGTFAEGVVGPLETTNPIFARTPAEQSAGRLLFSGLLSYDQTAHLRSELAKSWHAENDGKRYVVELKPDIRWHDGRRITADDVVYTVKLIKNPLVRSPLYASWSQISVSKVSERVVSFELVRPYAAFPHALTFGILPKHLLSSTPPERLREADFNRRPVGSGPFVFNRLQVINPDEGRVILYLERNDAYTRGSPKLERFQIHVFNDSMAVKNAYIRQEINAGVDFTSDELQEIASKRQDAIIYHTLLSDGMFVFLRNDSNKFADVNVRKAFLLGTDRTALMARLHGFVSRLDTPITVAQLPAASTKKQLGYNLDQAGALLDQTGWRLNGKTRIKDGVPLSIDLVSVKSGDYPFIVGELKNQWEKLGAKVTVRLVSPSDVQQTVLLPRNYDAFVYELELGADPDVFAYWHVSQADPRGLNLSNYKSPVASEALSSAQLRLETSVRQAKYQLFVDTWMNDVPAIALYQPQLHYVTSSDVMALQSNNVLASRIDRYRSIEQWSVNKTWRYTSP